MSVFHSNTERLIDYWRNLAGPGRAPGRAAVDPAAFADLLPQVFMLGRVCSGIYPIRLAGGFLGELHARDLRQQNALSLFRQRDRMAVQTALEMARRKPEPLVARVEARAGGGVLPFELTFAPIAGHGDSPERFLGLYQPLGMVWRLQGEPVLEFELAELSSAQGPAPRLRLAALDGRRIA